MEKSKESVIAECRPHEATFATHYILAILFAFMGFLLMFIEIGGEDGGGLYIFSGALFILCGGVLVLEAIVCKKTTYIALTETKIIGHIGFVKTKSITTPLSKVQDIGIENGLMGKIFGYHTITVSSAGSSGAEYEFKHMANAQKFVDAVLEQIDKTR